MTTLYDFTALDIEGRETPLREHGGKVLLIVNTASKCGFTPQYAGLEALHREFSPRGFAVLGFPCNQFGHQEPGDAAEIANFCKLTYEVDFPMFAKIEVNGPHAHPLFKWLTAEAPGVFGTRGVKWNFTKFLVDRSGAVAGRFAPTATPEALRSEIAKLI
jgi:glutathione peroxidase